MMDGWKRMLWAFGLFFVVTFLGQLIASTNDIFAIDVSTLKAAVNAAVLALIPVIVNFLMPFIRQYGIVKEDGETSLKL